MDLRYQTFLGLAIFAIGCFMFSELNLSIAINNVIIPNIVLGAGLTMVIIPTTTILFSTVKNTEMTNASSIQNLVKNVGCAVGTSSVGVFVSRFSQVHQTYLIDRLTVLNEAFAAKINVMTGTFMHLGHDLTTAQHMAHISIYQQLMQQATLSAFMTSYRTYALIIICVLPLVFLLRKVKQG